MSKYILFFLMMGQTYSWADPVQVDPEIALEDLFSEEDLAALKDDEEALLFDEISQSDAEVEELFQ